MNEETLKKYLITKDQAVTIAKSKLVKEKLKQYLAVLIAEKMEEENVPVSKAEQLAKADSRYAELIEKAQAVIAEAEMIKAEQKSIEMTFEFWRTNEASRRAEMKL